MRDDQTSSGPRRVLVALLSIAALAIASLGLAACAEKSENLVGEATPIGLTLDSRPNPDHAGIYMAQKLGHFRDAGLEVTIRTPADPAAPIRLAAAGRTDLAISHQPEVLLADDQGLDAVAVAALVDRPLASLIWLERSGIGGIAGLRGRTIATAGLPYQEALLGPVLARAGLTPDDVRVIEVGHGLLPALTGGRAEALFGALRNIDGVALRLRGRDPVVTPVDQVGVPAYDELVLVTQRRRLESDPEPVRLFLAALARGTAAAIERPGAAADAVLEANRDLDPRLTRAQAEATLPLLSADGRMDPRRWSAMAAWMRDNGLIEGRPTLERLLDNGLLPGGVPE